MQVSYCLFDAGELVQVVDVLLFVGSCKEGVNVRLALLGGLHLIQIVEILKLCWVVQKEGVCVEVVWLVHQWDVPKFCYRASPPL